MRFSLLIYIPTKVDVDLTLTEDEGIEVTGFEVQHFEMKKDGVQEAIEELGDKEIKAILDMLRENDN